MNNVIRETEGKAAVDAIAYLAGGSAVSTQGVVKFQQVNFLEAKGVAAIIPSEEIRWTGVTPGLRQRVEEFKVPWDWDEEAGDFAAEVFAVAGSGLSVASGNVSGVDRLDDDVARWVDTEAHARQLATQRVLAFGLGLIQWSFTTSYAHPELEPGDRIAIQTDRFIAHDPVAARALKGNLWAVATVVGVHNPWGTALTVWVQAYADIAPTLTELTRGGFGQPAVPDVQLAGTTEEDSYHLDATITVTDPSETGGTLELWTNPDAPDSADPTAASDGTETIPSGAESTTVGPTDNAALNSIRVPQGFGKIIYAQYTNALGQKSPQRGFFVMARLASIKGPDVGAGDTPSAGEGNLSADIEAEGDIFIPAAFAPKIGTAAAPGVKTKTLRMPFSEFVPESNTSNWIYNGNGYLHPGEANSGQGYVGTLLVPKGAIITKFRCQLYRETTSDSASFRVVSVPETGSSSGMFTPEAHTTTGWQTVTHTLATPETVAEAIYIVQVSLFGPASSDDARLRWIEVEYTVADYVTGI